MFKAHSGRDPKYYPGKRRVCRYGCLADRCLGPPSGTPRRPQPAACSSIEVGDRQDTTSEHWKSC